MSSVYMERLVADKLTDAGYATFPFHMDVIPRVKFELPDQLWTSQKDTLIGEADGIVRGNHLNFNKLKLSCPIHVINNRILEEDGERILIVKVKATAATFIQKIKEFDKNNNTYWIFRDTGLIATILYVNDGEASKRFVLHGGDLVKSR